MSELLSPAFLARLERLAVASKRSAASPASGERRSTLKGSSVEFADHREYQLGDDPRLLDWNAYARLEKLFIKLFLHEADLAVHVLLDASASMGSPDPDGAAGAPARTTDKFLGAKRLAAALAYVTLANLDRAGLVALGGRASEGRRGAPGEEHDRQASRAGIAAPLGLPGGASGFPPERGRGRILRMLNWLEALEPAGNPDPVAAFKRYAESQRRPGLSIVLSDFLDPRFTEALRALLHHRHELWCLQLLSPEDLGEGVWGDLELVDSETGGRVEVSATPQLLAAYRRRAAAFREETEAWCLSRGAGYCFVESPAAFEDVLLRVLRRRRLLR